MLRSDLRDYSDAYIAVKGRIYVRATGNTDIDQKYNAFKNSAPFRSCITKINSTLIDNAEDLDTVVPMYNLLEYSQNYSMTSGRLWNYYRDKIDDVDDNASDGKSFKYKRKIIRKTEARPARPELPPANAHGTQPPRPPQPLAPPLNAEVTIPLKYISNFWRCLDFYLINFEVKLDLKWSKNCIGFIITSTKLYVPVVNLSINDNINFLEKYKARI